MSKRDHERWATAPCYEKSSTGHFCQRFSWDKNEEALCKNEIILDSILKYLFFSENCPEAESYIISYVESKDKFYTKKASICKKSILSLEEYWETLVFHRTASS